MALTLEQKKTVVAEVAEVAQRAQSAVAADYIGLSVAEMMQLRAQARGAGVSVRVVKNTLARRALEGTDFECMGESLSGPLVLAFSHEDPSAAARVVRDFAKGNEKLAVRLVALRGKLLDPADIGRLANLPSREQALGMLLSVMKAPITKLARTLAEPHAKLVRTFGAIRDQKQGG